MSHEMISDIKIEVKNGEIILFAQKIELDSIPETDGMYYGFRYHGVERNLKWEEIQRVKLPLPGDKNGNV